MANKDYTVDIYQGGYSSLSPSYGNVFSKYGVAAGSLGLCTDPRTANVLKEVSTKLSTGIKQIELAMVEPRIFEAVPGKFIKELNRQSKLTGVDISVHGPVIEPSGITREGFTESSREGVEKQMNSVIERSHEINPEGNVPVTFHSSAVLPQPITPKGKRPEEVFVINSETGSINRLPLKEREFPGEEREPDVKRELAKINESQWGENIRSLSYYADIGDRAIKDFMVRATEAEKAAGKPLLDVQKQAISSFNMGTTFLNDSYRQLKELFELARKYGKPEEQKILERFSREIEPNALKIQEDPRSYESIRLMKEIIDKGVETFNEIKIAPEIYRPLDEFAKEKTVKTFANIALNSYKKFGERAPIVSIENPPAGGAFSTAEELKGIVEESRKKFVETAVKEGMSQSRAKEQAEKLLGATWDVGHINMLRRYGYESEDIIKETEKIAKLIKHVHLSDNFGFEHTELPMGMGNVPKEVMEKLPKDARQIIEAADWWQHIKTPPVQETLQALGSPMYAFGGPPSWNQAIALQQDYYLGLAGQWLPQRHYETFGTFFSQTPMELGGQMPGAQGGRMSGRPME